MFLRKMISKTNLVIFFVIGISENGFGLNFSIPMSDVTEALHDAGDVINTRALGGYGHSNITKAASGACAMSSKVTKASETTKNINRIANVMQLATNSLLEKYKSYPKKQILKKLQCTSIPNETKDKSLALACNRIYQVQCDTICPYRSTTGYCNNLKKPDFGAAYSEFSRILANVYEDGLQQPRSYSISGAPLSSPREISLAVHQTTSKLNTDHTHMLMVWGQFTDHDITLTPTAPVGVPEGIDLPSSVCKVCDSNLWLSDCLPIPLNSSDPIFGGNRECMGFVRSARGNSVQLGSPREQINQITSYIDASNVYGSETFLLFKNPAFTNQEYLRAFKTGKLKMTNRKLMPAAKYQDGCQHAPNGNTPCFLAGDIRNSEHMPLTSMQTLWVRQHNYIAARLRKVKSKWDDNRIFLETRRIIGAIHQRITYNEFLPAVIGPKLMLDFDIQEEPGNKYFTRYNDSCDATIFTEFATAAFRFGHTLVDGHFRVQAPNSSHNFSLFTNFFKPGFLYEQDGPVHHVLGLLIGATEQESQAPDRFITSVIRDHLFQNTEAKADGFDLAALNIQRCRDHGIPPYIAYRTYFTGQQISNFDKLVEFGIMNEETVSKLKSVYMHVDDIDLWTGVVSELPVEGGAVGLVGASIIGAQFRKLKHCDRFFYSNGPGNGVTGYFSPAQLKEIRKMSLSHILCRQAKGPYSDLSIRQYSMQKLVCEPPRNLFNCRIPCKDYVGINWKKWKKSRTVKKVNFQAKPLPDGRCIGERPGTEDFGVYY